MIKKQSLMLALAGASLLLASPARAQFVYNNEDVLLDFRNTTVSSDPDLTVDLGSINAFAALTGTTVLDTVSGVTPTPGYTTDFSATQVTGAVGSSTVGFSAVAANYNTGTVNGLTPDTLFLTRMLSGPTLVAPSAGTEGGPFTPSTHQGTAAQAINNIGAGAAIGVSSGTPGGDTYYSSGAGAVLTATAVTIADNYTSSYHSIGEASPSQPNSMSFGGAVNINTLAGGPVENIMSGSAVYSGLWDVPQSGQGTETYLGYFTYDPSGEVDFTSVNAVPEPSTYAMIAAAGLAAVAMRRQLRRLTA